MPRETHVGDVECHDLEDQGYRQTRCLELENFPSPVHTKLKRTIFQWGVVVCVSWTVRHP